MNKLTNSEMLDIATEQYGLNGKFTAFRPAILAAMNMFAAQEVLAYKVELKEKAELPVLDLNSGNSTYVDPNIPHTLTD